MLNVIKKIFRVLLLIVAVTLGETCKAQEVGCPGSLATKEGMLFCDDFAHLRWLGAETGKTEIFSTLTANRWFCIEAHVRLNSPGKNDGVFELWIDEKPEAARRDLNWVNSWSDYGINAIMFENYWNGGATAERKRYIDNIAIAANRIGCLSLEETIEPPRELRATIDSKQPE